MKTTKTPKRLRVSIRKDPVTAKDFLKYDFRYACEDCTHFKTTDKSCTLGYNCKNHLREEQLKNFQLSGRMALCRFLEID